MQRRTLITLITVILIDAILLLLALTYTDFFLVLSLGMIAVSLFPIFYNFEKRQVKAEEVILIAVLSSVAAVGRIPFAALPSIQPTSFIIILTGIVFGGEIGCLVGSIGALASNLLLGQGPWTPWQMFAWGMMGLSAGYFHKQELKGATLGLKLFGFAWGFIFGWIMNIWSLFGFFSEISWATILTAYAGSFSFDLLHAIGNVFFISLFATPWIKVLNRIKIKYGMLKTKND